MSGENAGSRDAVLNDAVRLERDAPQPGGREAAPGELAVVQSFINTHFDLVDDWGADVLATPPALAGWLTRRGLLPPRGARLTAADLDRAIAVREGLRSLAAAAGHASPAQQDPLHALNAAAAGAPLRVVFGACGPRLAPAGGKPFAGALGVILSIAYMAMVDGTWARLKACPGEHCGWAFYDNSRNNSGRWCSMSVCGGRAKARSHYRRRRDG